MNDELKRNLERITTSPSYRLAELDTDFLQRSELRPVRMQLELLKPEMTFEEQEIRSTIVVFGGTQIVERQQAERRLGLANEELSERPDDAQTPTSRQPSTNECWQNRSTTMRPESSAAWSRQLARATGRATT